MSRAGWIAGVLVVLVTAGCSGGPSSGPATVTVVSPTSNARSAQSDAIDTALLEGRVSQMMKEKFATDSEIASLHLAVVGVTLVHKAGNEYDGMATIGTPSGRNKDIAVHVTYDGHNIIWQTDPGALMFPAEDLQPPAAGQ